MIIMGVHIRENKLVITAVPKPFNFDLPEDIHNNLNHKFDPIIEHN